MMEALRFAPAQKYWYAPPQGRAKTIYSGPAMLAAVTDAAGQVVGCHVTWIDPDQLRDPVTAESLPAKKLRGTKCKGAIRLVEPKGFTRLVIGEGVETVLSAYAAEGSKMIAASTAYWAAIDLGHLGGKPQKAIPHPTLKTEQGKPLSVGGPWPELQPERDLDVPDQVTHVILLGDGDSEPFATEMALRRAAARWHKPGRTIKVACSPTGKDLNDVLVETGEDGVLEILRGAKPFPPLSIDAPKPKQKRRTRSAEEQTNAKGSAESASGGEVETKKRRTQRDDVLEVLVGEDIELWHDPSGRAFVSFANENEALRSSRFRVWARHLYYKRTGKTIGGQMLEDAIGILEGKAVYEGPTYETWVRFAEHHGERFVDLGDVERRIVEISKDRWHVTRKVPVKFLRPSAMRPLPVPEPGEPIELLGNFLNTASEEDFRLIVGWLLQAFQPNSVYAVLDILGEPGSTKTTACCVLRTVIDPSVAPLIAPPKDERDIYVSASDAAILAYDNFSHMPLWLADAFCRLATGGGFATRKLHTDDEQQVFSATRPILLNGIGNVAQQADLADRTILIHLPALRDGARRSDKEFWEAFGEVWPSILGALLDGVVSALRNFEDTKLERFPRMASFAQWVTAAERGLGWEAGSILRAYERNQQNVFEEAAEAEPLVVAIRDRWDRLVSMSEGSERDAYEASPAKMFSDLETLVSEEVRKSKSWPKGAAAFGTRIRKVSPVLRKLQFTINPDGKNGGRRFIRIMKRRDDPR